MKESTSVAHGRLEKILDLETRIKWSNAVVVVLYHAFAIYWCYYYTFPVKYQTVVLSIILYYVSGLGVSAGAHRYWSHRAFKANLPLQIIMLLFFAIAGQNTVQQWVRDHRMHHKYSDRHGDPHNASRGLFYSHIGWLMMKRHKAMFENGHKIDVSDIKQDPLLAWHERNFMATKLACCFIIPTLACVWLWGEGWHSSVAWNCFIRYLGSFHAELTVNSLAHAYGYRPFNKNIYATKNMVVTAVTVGDGDHNYHHMFPVDYKSAEFYDKLHFASLFIKMFAKIGWAYDLKEVTPEVINAVAKRLGDGSRPDRIPVTAEEIDKIMNDKVLTTDGEIFSNKNVKAGGAFQRELGF